VLEKVQVVAEDVRASSLKVRAEPGERRGEGRPDQIVFLLLGEIVG